MRDPEDRESQHVVCCPGCLRHPKPISAVEGGGQRGRKGGKVSLIRQVLPGGARFCALRHRFLADG